MTRVNYSALAPRRLRAGGALVLAYARPGTVLLLLWSLLASSPLLAAGAESPCVIGGCSGELCVHESEVENIASACVWSSEFDCYAYYGICKMQENDRCGWEQTYELQQCIQQHRYNGKQTLEPYREDEYFKNRR